MGEAVSKYYAFYLRGQYFAAQNKPVGHRRALDEYFKALEIKECQQIYRAILNAYVKLNDIDNTIKYAKKAFEFGDVPAMHFLGNIYYQEQFNKLDFDAAFECFQKCIEKKYVPAYVSVAKMYLNGQHVEKSEEKYLNLLNEALKIKNNGNVGEALEELGVYYYSKKDFISAVKYFKKSVAHGWIHSNFHLAICYKNGDGVKKDYDKYVEHLLNCYCKETYGELALLFSNNELVEGDNFIFETSIYYLANTGDAVGAIVLAGIYASKKPCDEKLVNYWLEKGFSSAASENGLKDDQIEAIKACVNPQFHKTIDDMAQKYLKMRRYEA